ncbi:hypothetical protein CUMW_255440 [Citrus unshiu]|uniref:Uncharacterized protein n=1 Tax=Citrus unshiu TaxID=55188 RepID=A0A2H5QSP2_CITUN|nr:hypothetical protein CUMW_255440 [Citrus unshiu]
MKSLKTRVVSGCWKLKEFLDIAGKSSQRKLQAGISSWSFIWKELL